MTYDLNRRRFINSILAGFAATQLPGCDSGPTAQPGSNSSVHRLPYAGIRIIELSETLTGRLAGLLFADQGAEVLIARDVEFEADEHDEFLDRNKYSIACGQLADTSSADVIILDGETEVDRASGQIVLRGGAALRGDTVYGDLPAE